MCYNYSMKYFDNASTTKTSAQALKTYVEASELYFNPSALYADSGKVKHLIEDARSFFVKFFGGKQGSTFIFTSCATESNNAVISSCLIRKDKKYIFSLGEHSSVYETAKHYKELGYNIVFVPLKSNGAVDETKLLEEVDESTAFVSVIHVSNETGAINDIEAICKAVKAKNPNVLFHSDGVQAVGKVNINLSKLSVDFYTISAHKINGPKGIGALYIANKSKFKPLLFGGGQEMSLRSGTENTPSILAFKTALENVKIKDYSAYKKAIVENLSGDFVLVSDKTCVNNIISVCFAGVRGETIAHILEEKGYLIGTGSACNSKAGNNRVLSYIVPNKYIEGAVRLSFDDSVSVEDCKLVAQEISSACAEYIKKVR